MTEHRPVSPLNVGHSAGSDVVRGGDDEYDDLAAPDEDDVAGGLADSAASADVAGDDDGMDDDPIPGDDEEDGPEVAAVGAPGSAAEDLRGLVSYLAASLVDDPEGVVVTVAQRGGAVHLSLQVPQEELGKVIGRQGRIARAIRTAVMVAGMRHDVRATLDIEG